MLSQPDTYGSHIPVLEAVVPKDCVTIEFGGGLHSTKELLKHGYLCTLENDPEWHAGLRSAFGDLQNWTLFFVDGLDAMLDIANKYRWEAAFVDCRPDKWRGRIGNALFEKGCPLIVFHDWEAQWNCRYKYLVVPNGYKRMIYHHKASGVRTAVFSTGKLPASIKDHYTVVGGRVIR